MSVVSRLMMVECPACKSRSLRASRLLNRWDGDVCSQCNTRVAIDINWKWAMLWLVPALLASWLLSPWLGDFSTAIAVVVSLALGFRLVTKSS
jgi:hypothetical protein